jgi:hypothetical protein
VSATFDPRRWLGAGFTTEQAQIWLRWRIPLETAVAWRAAGVPDGLRATQWSIAGVRPETVGDWRAAGVEAAEAVRWHEMGFPWSAVRTLKGKGLTPDKAFEERNQSVQTHTVSGGTTHLLPHFVQQSQAAGIPPDVMHSYLMAQWTDDDALTWARQLVPAIDARLWQLLGIRPVEAGRLTRQGQRPEEAIREWWRAGIPYDEVADWLGAGLSAQEAVAQRTRGITVEQAAALRALRNGDDGDDPDS